MTEWSKYHVIIVDDADMARTLTSRTLKSLGFIHVNEVSSGAEALSMIEHEGAFPYLILCDWQMPDMDGIDVLRVIRKSHPPTDLIFIMVSGIKEPSAQTQALEAGAQAYIVKPFRPQGLKKILSEVFVSDESAES